MFFFRLCFFFDAKVWIAKWSMLQVSDFGDPNEFKDKLFNMLQDPQLATVCNPKKK